MRQTYSHGGITWVDLESPTREEVAQTAAEFSIDPSIAEQLLLPTTKPHIEFYPNHIYTVMHFPALRHSHRSREQEIDFVIGQDVIITTHYDTIDPLHKFSKVFEVNTMLENSAIGDHAGFLFFALAKKLYKAVEHELDYIRRDLLSTEERIFSGEEVEMVSAISRSARDLLALRQSIEPHREILRALETEGPRFFGEAFAPALRALSDEYYRVHNHIMRQTESLHELRETNNSLLTTKQNETMRVLTIMALFTFPLALLTAIFDMHAQGNPLETSPVGFWIILGILIVFGSLMVAIFKHKHWL